MRTSVLTLVSSFVLLSSAVASAETKVLKSLNCENMDVSAVVEATYDTEFEQYALIEWQVQGKGLNENFMAPLSTRSAANQELSRYWGSTLGSSVIVDGDSAEVEMEVRGERPAMTFQLKCQPNTEYLFLKRE